MAFEDEIFILEGPVVKPLSYLGQIKRMPNKSDKFGLRRRTVKHAIKHGVKPTARVFDKTPKTAREWLERYRREHPAGPNAGPRQTGT